MNGDDDHPEGVIVWVALAYIISMIVMAWNIIGWVMP